MWRRANAFDELFDVFREFDSLFRRTYQDQRNLMADDPVLIGTGNLPALAAGSRGVAPRIGGVSTEWAWAPAVECLTRGKELLLRAELPGVDPANVEVTVNGRQLTLSGEKKTSQETQERNVHYRETVQGRFSRTFMLPEEVKPDQVKAAFSNGVLEITMPAEGVVKARTVPIEVGAAQRKSIQAA